MAPHKFLIIALFFVGLLNSCRHQTYREFLAQNSYGLPPVERVAETARKFAPEALTYVRSLAELPVTTDNDMGWECVNSYIYARSYAAFPNLSDSRKFHLGLQRKNDSDSGVEPCIECVRNYIETCLRSCRKAIQKQSRLNLFLGKCVSMKNKRLVEKLAEARDSTTALEQLKTAIQKLEEFERRGRWKKFFDKAEAVRILGSKSTNTEVVTLRRRVAEIVSRCEEHRSGLAILRNDAELQRLARERSVLERQASVMTTTIDQEEKRMHQFAPKKRWSATHGGSTFSSGSPELYQSAKERRDAALNELQSIERDLMKIDELVDRRTLELGM